MDSVSEERNKIVHECVFTVTTFPPRKVERLHQIGEYLAVEDHALEDGVDEGREGVGVKAVCLREVDRDELRGTWAKQDASLGFDAKGLVAEAMVRHGTENTSEVQPEKDGLAAATRQPDLFEHAVKANPARTAVDWALAHLSERDAVFSDTGLLAAALAFDPGSTSIGDIEGVVAGLKREGRLHDAPALEGGSGLTTDKALAGERETIALMRSGAGRGRAHAGLDGGAAPAQGTAHRRAETGG